VVDRRADVGLTYVPHPHADLAFRPIAAMSFGIYAQASAFRRTPFKDLPFAVPVSLLAAAPSGAPAVDGWPEGVYRNVRFRLSMLQTALELATRGHCAVFIPDVIAKLSNRRSGREGKLTKRRGPQGLRPVSQTAYLVTRVERQDEARWEALAGGLAQLLSG
jgi:hypothetical protein